MKKTYYFKTLGIAVVIQLMLMSTNAIAQNKYALDFNGTDESLYQADQGNHLDVTSAWTFECWINADAQTGYDDVMYRDGVFNFSLRDKNATGAGDFGVYFRDRASSINLGTEENENLSFDTWYHVAATYDGTTARLYVDGTEVDSDGGAWNLATSSNNLNIAARYVSGYSNYFDGQIDEVRMSDIARAVGDMQTATHFEEYSSDANTVFLMHYNDEANTPTYVSGVGYTGNVTSHNISSADYLFGEVSNASLLQPNFQSKATGNWNVNATWEYRYGSTGAWTDATSTPLYRTSADITILNGHTITISADVEIDQTTIASGGQVTISSGITTTLNNGNGIDLDINGTLKKSGSLTQDASATIEVQSGGKYQHDTDASVSTAIWNSGSTCEVVGVGSGTTFLELGGVGQSFHHFIWNSSTQARNIGLQSLTSVAGDFTMQNSNGNDVRLVTSSTNKTLTITGNTTISGGILELTNASGKCFFVCYGDYTQSGGTISGPGIGTGLLRFGPGSGSGYSGTFTHSGGTFTPEDIQVNTSYALTLASDMNIGTAPFTVYGTFTVPSSYTFTIPSGGLTTLYGEMTVDGTLTNSAGNAGLLIKSTATEQGSLIHNTASVAATVERQITQWSGDDDGWHLLSSPVNNFAIASSDFEPTAGDDDLFGWDESNNYWENYHLDPGPGFAFNNLTNGEGYLCAYKTTATKNFDGQINVSDVTQNNLSAVDGKWHCLGNPFASALDWSAGTWAVTDVSVPQVYKESDGNYYAVNTGSGGTANIIPSTQGFFVEVADATNTITIPADARVHDAQGWYKQSNELDNTLKLKLTGGNNSFCDYTLLSFNDDATEEYDIEFDSHKLFGMPSAPQMYTLSIEQDKFSYNIVPTFDNEKLIPLNIKVPSVNEYTINVEINNVVMEGDIFLEDLLTNQITNLSSINYYAFQANPQDDPNRFVLHFNGTSGIDDGLNNQEKTVLIYSNNNQVYVKSLNDNMLSGTIAIRNIAGQTIYNQQLNNINLQRINTNLNTGIYIVSLKMEDGYVISQKVMIQ